MTKKKFAIHGTGKNKHIFDVHPVVHVYADNEEQAIANGKNIMSMNPIYDKHFDGAKVKAVEQANE